MGSTSALLPGQRESGNETGKHSHKFPSVYFDPLTIRQSTADDTVSPHALAADTARPQKVEMIGTAVDGPRYRTLNLLCRCGGLLHSNDMVSITMAS